MKNLTDLPIYNVKFSFKNLAKYKHSGLKLSE